MTPYLTKGDKSCLCASSFGRMGEFPFLKIPLGIITDQRTWTRGRLKVGNSGICSALFFCLSLRLKPWILAKFYLPILLIMGKIIKEIDFLTSFKKTFLSIYSLYWIETFGVCILWVVYYIISVWRNSSILLFMFMEHMCSTVCENLFQIIY